ncbi:hypothetical protein [Arthrobacter sp. 92]|jgi:hypothetical protein|uniref:hypothetical protein n=1 Tax=Arthrobacter sp. 92 TaxID=3418175 RepID=UPI003CFCB280
MNSYEPVPENTPHPPDASTQAGPRPGGLSPARVGTVVWGLIVVALAALIVVAQLRIVELNGTYVLIGLTLGAGTALVVGGLISARGRDKKTSTRKS